MPESYTSLAIKRQAILERLKTGEVVSFAKEIKKIERLIRRTIGSLDGELTELSRVNLNKLLRQLEQDQGTIFKAATDDFLDRSADIAAVYQSQEVIDLTNTIDLRGTKLDSFTSKGIFAKVIQRPLSTDGNLLKPWIKDFSRKEIVRVSGAIRAGHAQGATNQELIRSLTGTKSKNYRDALLETTRRNASTVVRTSVQHVASAARHEVWEANRDVISSYEFLATLDGVTSAICRTLDGQIFEFGKGPIPPIHPNCRSTTIPVLDEKYSFLSKGRTRSAEDGPVSAKTEYYDWLKRQNKQDQIDVLGPKRAKLFRDGGLSAEKFRALQFDKNFAPLTLSEMQKMEPAAFAAAGL